MLERGWNGEERREEREGVRGKSVGRKDRGREYGVVERKRGREKERNNRGEVSKSKIIKTLQATYNIIYMYFLEPQNGNPN